MARQPLPPSRAARVRALLTVVLSAAVLAGCHAGTMHRGTSGSVTVEGENTSVRVTFGTRERRIIRDWYGSRRGDLPPGLAKKDELPPGLRKQVERDGRLPPGLEGRRLPGQLERRLGPPPEGYVRVRIGADIVLMEQGTRVIADIVRDIPLD